MALASITSAAHYLDNHIDLSRDARNLAAWVIDSANNQDLPFIIIDKKEAKVFIFRPNGTFLASSPALIGRKIGDDITPGVGQKRLAEISIEERTTPAGRYLAGLGTSIDKSELVWIDYESGVSIHPVTTSNPSERRLERLASSRISDRRITYGCVNVSNRFYKEAIHPTFENSSAIVYILPEVHSIKTVFGAEADSFSHHE
ncbi:L,D-transpeptidase [Polynucleobacter arcticus]|uniref:L,D-transpeptidase n=2 Tax=Polynucleobacter arcticus TaxID=1743165 RepID=A0A6M9PLR8_9BURK|nr:hypothetical protein DN92_01930 [Polynucleobacter arcticus]